MGKVQKLSKFRPWTDEDYNVAVDAILEQIATSELGLNHVIEFCRSQGMRMPDPATFYRWLTEREELHERYTRAREQQQHYCIDTGVVLGRNLVARTPEYSMDPAGFRAYFDAVKWRASKLYPKVYGEKQQLEHSGPGGGPVQTEVVQIYMPSNGRDGAIDVLENKHQDSGTN